MLESVNIEGKEAVLLGDLNCDYLKERHNRSLKNILMGQGFSQKITEPTRVTKESKSLIDVVLTNASNHLAKSIVIDSCLSDHCMIGAVRKMHAFRLPPREIYCRNYRNYNKELFLKDLKSVPWEHV